MTIIRIITSEVLKTAKQIEKSGSRVQKVGGRIRSAGTNARTYEKNTFGPTVRDICNDASARALNIGCPLNAMAGILTEKANKFVSADENFFTKSWRWIKGLFDRDGQDNWATDVEEKNIKERSVFGEILEKGESIVDNSKTKTYLGTAEKVPLHSSPKNHYKRLGWEEKGSPKSNCTWYAWEAILLTTGIQLENWGHAGNWPSKAREAKYVVDNVPTPGSIICFDGHVAFVESVEYNNDGTVNSITWSEEQAGGNNPWRDGPGIVVDGKAQIRYRHTKSFDTMKKYNPQYIHIQK